MILNVFLAFVLPWIVGIWLYKQNKKLFFLMFPFFSMVAFTVNQFGFWLGFWDVKPIYKENPSFSSLPFDLGLYPILVCLMIYFINDKKKHPFLMILSFVVVVTVLEFIYFSLGKVIYGNGWNMYWTVLSYLVPTILTYFYYLKLKKHFRF